MSSTTLASQAPTDHHDAVPNTAALPQPQHLAHPTPPRTNSAIMIETHDLSLDRQDLTAFQQARAAIDLRRHQNQSAVGRYEKMWARSIDMHPAVPASPNARVHLNPSRAWCRLRTPKFLDGNVSPPATALLFALGDDFATEVFDLEGQTLINELADYQPCTLDQWSALSALATRDELVAWCVGLQKSGLVCIS